MSTIPPTLPLSERLEVGFITSFDTAEAARETAQFAEARGYDSIWVGDHVSFPMPTHDPLLLIAQAAAASTRLRFGTGVYLLPLRHPVLVAKQVTTLDHLCGGRFCFGVGIGGEFPGEYASCGIPVEERGARLSEAIPLLKRLFSGDTVTHEGRFFPIPETRLLPVPRQTGGPPIWCGGRSAPALQRMGRMADGWISYVVTPKRFREGLDAIARAAEVAQREIDRFGTGHLLFARVDTDFASALDAASEHLSQRYAMDFRDATRRYAALGRPEDVAERIGEFREAGVRHIVLDCVGPWEDRVSQLERFASEVMPLLDSQRTSNTTPEAP
ncbi:MAG: LLM class flavin-dependent oxidoreductase [Myxococcales bacterium]|nr:LLM class flavin-dependent oxidoreductase [Myxococcales bacterium]